MTIYQNNLSILSSRYPNLAGRIDAFPDKEKVIAFHAKDGGIAYGLRTASGIQPITDPTNPLTRIGNQLTQNSEQLNDFSKPIMLVGLYPGDELLYLYNLAERIPVQATQRIYVAIDSIACLYAFLQNMDASAVLQSDRVKFFHAEEATALANEFRANSELSYFFTLISGSHNGTINKVMTPFVNLVNERNAEFKRMIEENKQYYDSIDDETLANIICSKAGRPPRLMTLTSSHSTVTQYSCRDLCAIMEKSGWETVQLLVSGNPTPHYLVSRIHQFKPDVFLFVNHLRSEAPSVYPANMMFLTWVQDTVPHINRHETAEAWNEIACGSSNQRSEDRGQKTEVCKQQLPLSSHNSTTQQPINLTTIKPRKRDLIIGYTSLLEKYGYREDRLFEMPMIVNPDIFKPRDLTQEQIEKYGCDIMFASNGSKPTEEIVRDTLVPTFANLKPSSFPLLTSVHNSTVPSHMSCEARGAKKEQPTTNNRPESDSCTSPAPQGDPFPSKSMVYSLGSMVSPPLFPESLLLSIHDHLWTQYRAGRTFTSYEALEQELCSLADHRPQTIDPRPNPSPLSSDLCPLSSDHPSSPSLSSCPSVKNSPSQDPTTQQLNNPTTFFSQAYDQLSEDDRDFVIQTLFWRLNDVIYRQVVLEWLDDFITSEEDHRPQTTDCRPKSESCTSPAPQGEKSPSALCSLPSASSPSPLPSDLCPLTSSPSPLSALCDLRERFSRSQFQVSGFRFHPSLKLHLYGKGWEHHPRFAKYAKGPLAHGEELSIAYQAAKLCLHLNSMEGAHQRISEIHACGANVLTRRAAAPDTAFNAALRKLASHQPSSADDVLHNSMTAEEQEALYDWVFDAAYAAASETDTCDQQHTQIEQQVLSLLDQEIAHASSNIFNFIEHTSFKDKTSLSAILHHSPNPSRRPQFTLRSAQRADHGEALTIGLQ